MKSMHTADQLPASTGKPAIRGRSFSRVASTSSINAEQNDTRDSSEYLCENLSVFDENLRQPTRPAIYPSRQTMTHASNQDHTVRRRNSRDLLKLERERESVIHLAQFLRTQSPPPDNYVSLPETGQPIPGRRSPFKIFRRQNSKKSSDAPVKTLRLPDSAVAAKTIQGHWHIAISIPVEHDNQDPDPPSRPALTKHAKAKSSSAIRDGPITVLKPFIQDVRPAVLDNVHTRSQSWDHAPEILARPRFSTAYISPDSEIISSAQENYDQKMDQDNTISATANQLRSYQPRCQNDNKTSSHDLSQQQSRQSLTRNSTETASTFASVESSAGHKRGQSSISTAPSINYPASPGIFESPKRRDSASGETLDHTCNYRSLSVGWDQSIDNNRTDEALRPSSVDSDIFSANVNVAATAQGYGPSDIAGTQVIFVRKALQTPGPAPTSGLPDLPRDPYGSRPYKRLLKGTIIRADRQPPHTLGPQSHIPSDFSMSQQHAVDIVGVTQTRQSRRERVKALRSRDMAKLKAMKKYEQVMVSVTGIGRYGMPVPPQSIAARAEPHYRPGQKRSLSYVSIAEEILGPKTSNALTPIMAVADVKPTSASPDPSIMAPSLPAHRLNQKEMAMNTGGSKEVRLPPRSITPSSAAFDEEIIQFSQRRSSTTTSTSQIRNHGSSGQHYGHLKRHKSMPDESMEVRIRRIEASNAMIVRALSAVLDKLLPVPSDQADHDRDPIESLVQDLRSAVRMGQEELAKYGHEYEDEALSAIRSQA